MIRFIEDHKEVWGAEGICRTLNVSPSTYYAARSRPLSARGRRDAELTERIKRVHEESGGTFGARRVWAELRDQGVEVARCTVERLMRKTGLSGVSGAPALRRDCPVAGEASRTEQPDRTPSGL
ncbi:IS3 family transposase [Streptomyces sp. NPDC048297]|uniref:IS3 family transposase n=1 Tax=Streptomyces sp. NPDC048297 TaxID=3365531 RepID=UPI0037134571